MTWKPIYIGSSVQRTVQFAFKKKGDVEYTPPAPSAEEQELLNLLLNRIKTQDANAATTQDFINNFVSTDFSKGALTAEQEKQLQDIQDTYLNTRKTAINEQADLAEKKIRQRYAAQGILDSSVTGDTAAKMAKDTTTLIDQAAKEAATYRYGTEQDLRNAALQESLQKIGILSSVSDPSLAANVFGSLTGQRQQYENTALQVALANAQNSGGFGSLLGSTLGMGLGLLFPSTALGGLGSAAIGGALGGGVGGTLAGAVNRGFR